MRKTKIVKLDDEKEVTLKEMKNKHIWKILENTDESGNLDIAGLLRLKAETVLLWCSDLTPEQFGELSQSETETLWQEFKKLNSFFFQTAESLNLHTLLRGAWGSLSMTFLSGFNGYLRNLSAPGTGTLGNTAGASPASASGNMQTEDPYP